MTSTADPFLELGRSLRARAAQAVEPTKERAHSKFSASGAVRWFNCPGSVALSEGMPDKSSIYAIEGTKAHKVLEDMMVAAIAAGGSRVDLIPAVFDRATPIEMQRHAVHAANVILGLHAETPGADVMVETRIYLPFIHPEMFGTFDGAVVDYFGTLHVFDYKYGAGVPVGPRANLQMIFYGIGLAAKFNWNFKRVRLWIIQPRIPRYEGPLFWEITVEELRAYVGQFKQAVARVEREPRTFVEGSWCHWCKAKAVCPLKQATKLEAAKSVFAIAPAEKLMIENFY